MLPAFLSAAAPYLLSAGAGLLGSSTRKSTPGSGGQVMVAPQYSFTEPRLRLTSDFISDNLSRMQRGEAPAYFDRAVPAIRSSMQQGVDTTYFGRKGDRTAPGTVNAALTAGALAGTGARPGLSGVNKTLTRYEEASNAIEDTIAKMRMEETSKAYGTNLYASAQLPKGPDYFVTPGYGPQTTEGAAPWLSAIAGGLAYNASDITKSLDAMWGGGKVSGGYQSTYYPGAINAGGVPGGAAPADYYLSPAAQFTSATSAAAPSTFFGSLGSGSRAYYDYLRGGADVGAISRFLGGLPYEQWGEEFMSGWSPTITIDDGRKG